MNEIIKPEGIIQILFGDEEIIVKNRILRSGRVAMAKALANSFGSAFEYFVVGVSFGSGGTAGGVARHIDETRTGLFGPTLITKPVITSIDPDIPYRVVVTTVLTYDELVGNTINEMGLKLKSGDYYSLATFGDITKTSSLQLTVNWSISFA